jgi:hypothetical protein
MACSTGPVSHNRRPCGGRSQVIEINCCLCFQSCTGFGRGVYEVLDVTLMKENLDLEVRGGTGMKKLAKERKPPKSANRRGEKDSTRQPTTEGGIERLIKNFEESLGTDGVKPSVSEYIRLKQLRKELDVEELKEIKVTWVEPTEKEPVTKT